ncbi:unnamed protein product [Medioppia subpectinata]|uniref:RING-type domain-containing protein n=1 Tax=Medioppia subpectinata TaxID=1979941 RepID=A0A7R9LHI0_9ACAR|nr:unnamed protein product [Medioppia subpectinata]CAG2118769.1 unnamed protein product [Medioppia subpectinata]
MNGENECVICLGDMSADVYQLNCGHRYHFDCIGQWFITTPNCPICRQAITTPTLIAYWGRQCLTPIRLYLNELRTGNPTANLISWSTPQLALQVHPSSPTPLAANLVSNQTVANEPNRTAPVGMEPNASVISGPTVRTQQANGSQRSAATRPEFCWNYEYIRRHRPMPYVPHSHPKPWSY